HGAHVGGHGPALLGPRRTEALRHRRVRRVGSANGGRGGPPDPRRPQRGRRRHPHHPDPPPHQNPPSSPPPPRPAPPPPPRTPPPPRLEYRGDTTHDPVAQPKRGERDGSPGQEGGAPRHQLRVVGAHRGRR